MNRQIQSDNIQKIVVPVLIAVLALGAGYYAGQYVGRQEQVRALKEIFSGDIFANGINLFGEITAISGDKQSLTVNIANVMGATLPKEYQNKTVLITGDTKIVLRENKTPEVFNEEVKKYQASLASVNKGAKNAVMVPPPSPYSERVITVGELEVGDTISVSSKSETGVSANVLDNRFTAIEVSVTR